MGVHGLWRLIEPSGKPVPLETLENKVLAVDVSIWLHQAVKGFQDSRGGSVPNAHLLGIYHRICKLLYFRIKPVFVFDGGVPVLKKQTIAKRNQQKFKNLSEADRIKSNLLSTLLKHTAISKVLSEKTKAEITAASLSPTKKTKTEDNEVDLYVLPPSQLDSSSSFQTEENISESSSEGESPSKHWDLHSINTESKEFKLLPVEVRHEILTDLKDTRKQSSWGRIHELPTESDDFSGYQMRRLLKRQSVQTALEEAEKEMGGHSLSIAELEKLLKDQGVITTNNSMVGNRIASDENTRFLLIKDIKQAIEKAKKGEETFKDLPTICEITENEDNIMDDEQKQATEEAKNKSELEYEDDLKIAIALSLQDEPSTSKQNTEIIRESDSFKEGGSESVQPSLFQNLDDADFDSESSEECFEAASKFTSAKNYMLEYSGLTSNEIGKILASRSKKAEVNKVSPQIKNIDNIVEIEDAPEIVSLQKKDLVVESEPTSKTQVVAEGIIDESDSDDLVEVDVSCKGVSIHEESLKDLVVSKNLQTSVTDSPASESSDSDFVDVESKTGAMEVVIKPIEELEDDLFKDVFDTNILDGNTTNGAVNLGEQIKEIVEQVNEKLIQAEDDAAVSGKDDRIDRVEKPNEIDEVNKDNIVNKSQGMKENIQRIINQYSKPREDKNDSKLCVEQMSEIQENLRKEQRELAEQRSTKERMASNITDQMYQEAQELLHLFGVPYVVAPMEAEAQCAFLELADLTNGTITDDSDIWLFGGATVYKNFFNQSKMVLEFKAENILQHFKLSRDQMILLAMLVGSDYTVGLQGVGPVTALEILAAFPPKPVSSQLISGLAEFRSWFDKGKLPGPTRTSLRSKLKNLKFIENFPNQHIVQAYLEPQVDTSKEEFSWAKPDITGLVDFAKRKFGWTRTKSEEILNPVVKRLEEKRSQMSIRDYFKSTHKIDAGEVQQKMSKRVKTALNKIGKASGDQEEEAEEKEKTVRKKRTAKKDSIKADEAVKPKRKRKSRKSKEVDDTVDEDIEVLKRTQVLSKERIEEIGEEIQSKLNEDKERMKKGRLSNLHKKEVIPQKQKDKSDILKNKLKAIETFRKSKKGPGYVKKRGKVQKASKDDAGYLSESSDD